MKSQAFKTTCRNSRKKQDRQDRLRRDDIDAFFLISNILSPKAILPILLFL